MSDCGSQKQVEFYAPTHQLDVSEAAKFHALQLALNTEDRYRTLLTNEQISLNEQRTRIAKLKRNQIILVAQRAGALIGYLGLWGGNHTRNHHCARMTIAVLKEHQGRGVARNLLLSTSFWCYETGITRIEATCRKDNPALLWYERQGFQREGIRRNSIDDGGVLIDEIYLGLLLRGNV
jgi:ribosomal protein S18 acetylase RimI-like enzyme